MKILHFVLLVLLVSCGKKFDSVEDAEPLFASTSDKNIFLEETKEFVELENISSLGIKKSVQIEADNLMNNIPINIYDVKTLYKSQGFVAVCRKSSRSGKREILVDKQYWYQNLKNKNILKSLIVHELGHCQLGKTHNDPSGGCRSIMETRLNTSYNSYDLKNKTYYAQELFRPKTPCTPLDKFLMAN